MWSADPEAGREGEGNKNILLYTKVYKILNLTIRFILHYYKIVLKHSWNRYARFIIQSTLSIREFKGPGQIFSYRENSLIKRVFNIV